MIQKQKPTKGLKMKETPKDKYIQLLKLKMRNLEKQLTEVETPKNKYIKLLNNTMDVGNCSKCESTDLVYEVNDSLVDGDDVFKDYTCNDCNYEGVEWYTFNGHSDKNLPSQYYSEIRDELNKLSH
ncbi:MAG: hypothetical protein EXR24_07245 [Ignavibacteria bacterium]|nr:hypothetical protein [Ignavibacteria bacterium]